MQKLLRFVLCGVYFLVLQACDVQIQDFVKDAKRREHFDTPPQNDEAVRSPMSLKLTPGKMNGVAPGMAVQGTISPTNQRFALGSDRALVLTLSRQRVLPETPQ